MSYSRGGAASRACPHSFPLNDASGQISHFGILISWQNESVASNLLLPHHSFFIPPPPLSTQPVFTDTPEHMGSYHQHPCAAEAYETRGRAFRGRELRCLVTSKAGHNQAGGGSFLSAASRRKVHSGLRWWAARLPFLTQRMMKTPRWLFLHHLFFISLIKRQSSVFADGGGKKKECSLTFLHPAKQRK